MNSCSRKGREGREGDAFYLPLSTWQPWREALGFFHAKVAKDGKGGVIFNFGFLMFDYWKVQMWERENVVLEKTWWP
jgi:hypothetical protein